LSIVWSIAFYVENFYSGVTNFWQRSHVVHSAKKYVVKNQLAIVINALI
jgi:hypothetical protein